jgi:hypothetical protein
MRRWPAIAVGCAALLTLPCVAGAAPVFLSRPGEDPASVALAVNTRGDYVLAWPTYTSHGPFGVMTGSVADQAPVAIRHVAGRYSGGPEAAIAADGTRGLIWATALGGNRNVARDGIDVATQAPGSPTWSVQRVGQGETPQDITLVFGAQGHAVAAWTPYVHGRWVVMVALRPPGGRFGSPRVVYREPSGIQLAGLSLGVDAEGRPTLVWMRDDPRAPPYPRGGKLPYAVETANGDQTGHFGPVRRLASGCYPDAFVEAPSGAAAISMQCPLGAPRGRLRLSQRPPGGAFARATLVYPAGRDDFQSALALRDEGLLTVTWVHRRSLRTLRGPESSRVMVAHAQIGGPLSPATGATAYGDTVLHNTVVSDPLGRRFLAWVTYSGVFRIAALGDDDRLGLPSVPLATDAVRPIVAVDGAGHGIAAWFTLPENRARAVWFSIPG